jgi:hypothetical protein
MTILTSCESDSLVILILWTAVVDTFSRVSLPLGSGGPGISYFNQHSYPELAPADPFNSINRGKIKIRNLT